ncbi:N-acetylmuramoyl-L-alanine amidase [uncultured archaeon]|nr:N-acetylmuramoyl-L-alanine amidase [uncultured archaeon]
MKSKKLIFVILLVGILFFSFNVQSYFYSTGSQYTSPRTTSAGYLANQGISLSSGFDANVCNTGQDFILQVSPLGCSPTVVRSDILEEQNYPVFCSISATKVNPLIDVNAISSITFSGKYPDSVAGIGYHPARAALKTNSETLLNSPILENIGYVVVVLKQNKNESSMPDFVSGNLTATLNYDIQNAFGIGQVTYYLPEISDADWAARYDEYGFWQGRGYLRATGIDKTGATVSIYSDGNRKINSANLAPGESSKETFLPNFYCAASLQTRLDGLVNPDSRARLNINGEINEVAQGETFLDGACSLSKVEKQGLLQRVDGTCKVDEGSGQFSLLISPTLTVSTTGVSKSYIVGDKLEGVSIGSGAKSIYVGYVGKASRGTPYIVLVASPLGSSDEFRARSPIYSRLPSYMRYAGDPGHGKISKIAGSYLQSGVTSTIFLAQGDYIVGVKCLGGKASDCDEESENSGIRSWIKEKATVDLLDTLSKITFKGFAQPSDTSLSVSGDPTYYSNAINDYRRIFTQFPNEQVEGDTHVAGENALYKGIILSNELAQYKQMLELCNMFEGAYPTSDYKPVLDKLCKNNYGMSNSQISSKTIFVNGLIKKLSLEGIYEPNPDEYSVELTVRKKGQILSGSPFSLTKSSTTLIQPDEQDTIFEYSVGGFSRKMYFQYVNGGWYGSQDYSGFLSAGNLGVTGGSALAGAILLGGPAGVGTAIGVNALEQYVTQNGLGPFGDGLKSLRTELSGKNFQQGRDILKTKGATTLPLSPVAVSLSNIQDEDNAVISIGVSSLDSVTGAETSTALRTLKRGESVNAGNYEFTIENIHLQRVAKVSVIPAIKKTGTSANFTFHVGIEKRAIQLSPTQIKNKISQLDSNIKQWEGLSKNLGAVVEGFKGACLGIGATITVKNFFTNLGGEGIAREKVMTSAGGWNDLCKDQVKKGNFSSMDSCLLANNDAIEKDISLYNGVISSQAEITEKNIAQTLPTLFSQLPPPYNSDPVLSGIFTSKTYENCSSVSLSQARDLTTLTGVLNSGASEELKKISQTSMKATIDSIRATSEGCAAKLSFSNDLKIDPSHVGQLPTVRDNALGIPTIINVQELPYYGDYYRDISGSFKAGTEIVAQAWGPDTPVAFYEDYLGHFLIIILKQNRIAGSYSVLDDEKERNLVYVYDQNGTRERDQRINNNLKSVSFKKADRSLFANSIDSPEASYFETTPYKGLPAIVPFRVSEGWYAAVRQTVPAGGQIRAYDESGAASSFYICNVGKNRRIDFGSSSMDDTCEGFNTGVGLKYNSFYGLSQGEIDTLVKDATGVLQQAGQQYPGKNNRITIRTSKGAEEIVVGKPAVDNPEIQCQNFMSAQDCWILFNACDPVICPPSRCNLGGTYPVSNVIQSGLVGSTLLCLPNIKEKIAVPVCLTGVKAGMDGIISLFQNYRDCLQTNLDSGQTIGICDEIHSIYLCEMIWRQTIPFAQMGLPTILEAIMGQGERGGGEYLSVQNAWNTADKSLQYIAQYYGAGSYTAFKTKATEEIGSAICKNSVSATYPSGGDLLDTLLGSDSPSQYYGWFDEIPMTTATVPPTSMYKVFYHVYAGKTQGVYYSVYLKSGEGSSYYQNNPVLGIPEATGYIAAGKYASATREIVAPTGYKDLCINVNGQEQCGFKKTTTDFGVNYLEEMYVASQADNRDITTESGCVSGTFSLYPLANPNVQEGVDNTINPEIYNQGLIRICATDNPGKGTDSNWNNPQTQRWKEVGYCDNQQIKCWLDSNSVRETLKSTDLINQSLGDVTNSQLKKLLEEGIKTGQYIDLNDDYKAKLNALSDEQKIATIDENLIDKALYNFWKAYLIKVRGDAYFNLSIATYQKYLASLPPPAGFSSGGGIVTPLSPTATGTCVKMQSATSATVIPQITTERNPEIQAQFFPVAQDSIQRLGWNFGQRRSNGNRCHTGFDIITRGEGKVIAMDKGVVVNKYPFYKGSYALVIEHTTTDGQKYVVNYGEMNPESISSLNKGSTVTAGQQLGTATMIGMLHLEIYKSGTTQNQPWYPPAGQVVGSDPNDCWNKGYTLPSNLYNPSKTLEVVYKKQVNPSPTYTAIGSDNQDEGINPNDQPVAGGSTSSFKVCIDAGHNSNENPFAGTSEAATNLQIAQVLQNKLSSKYSVIMSRIGDRRVTNPSDSDKCDSSQRAYFANSNGCSIVVSIHSDASAGGKGSVIICDGAQQTRNDSAGCPSSPGLPAAYKTVGQYIISNPTDKSNQLAQKVLSSLQPAWSSLGVNNGGVITDKSSGAVSEGAASSIGVLCRSSMPSILVEVADHSDSTQANLIKDPAFQNNIADAIAKGVDNYYSSLSGGSTGLAILDFGITGNAVSGTPTRCENCNDVEPCTSEQCSAIAKQIGQDCKFTDSSNNAYQLSSGGITTQIDAVTNQPLSGIPQTGTPSLSAQDQATTQLRKDFAGFNMIVSPDGKQIELLSSRGELSFPKKVIFDWDNGNRWYAVKNTFFGVDIIMGAVSASRLDRFSSATSQSLLGINQIAINFGKLLGTKTNKDFANGNFPQDLSDYRSQVTVKNTAGTQLYFKSAQSQLSTWDNLYFDYIPETEGQPWVVSLDGTGGSTSYLPISRLLVVSGNTYTLSNEVTDFAKILKTKTPDQMKLLSGAGSTFSPIFKFQNGRAGTSNLFYRFNFLKSSWDWADNSEGPWLTSTNPTFTANLDQKDKDFMAKIGKVTTYDDGLNLLIDRTLNKDQGGITDAALSSGGITLTHEGNFLMPSDKITLQLEDSGKGVEWVVYYRVPNPYSNSGAYTTKSIILKDLIKNNFKVSDYFTFSEKQKTLLANVDKVDTIPLSAKLIFNYGNNFDSGVAASQSQGLTPQINAGATVYFFGDSLTQGISDAMKPKIPGATFVEPLRIGNSRIDQWANLEQNCQGQGNVCDLTQKYPTGKENVTVFVVLGTNGCNVAQGKVEIQKISNQVKSAGAKACYWIGPMWVKGKYCKESSDSIKQYLSGQFCTFIDSTEFANAGTNIKWDAEQIHPDPVIPNSYAPWADFISQKLTSLSGSVQQQASTGGASVTGDFVRSSWVQPAKTAASIKSLEAQKMYAAEVIRIAREIQQKRGITDESVKKDTGVANFYQLVLNLVDQESAGLRHCRGGKDQDAVYGAAPVAYQNIFTCDGNNEKVMRSYGGGSEVGMFQITSVHDSRLKSLGLDKYKFKDNADYGINLLIDNYKPSGNWNEALRRYNGGGDANYVTHVLAHQTEIANIVSNLA